MFIHELDRGTHNFDDIINVTPEEYGLELGSEILQWMRRNSRQLAPDAKFLGLGAGAGHAEMALAQKLGIANDKVTLMDRNEDPLSTDMRPGVQYRVSGLFGYLDQPDETGFSVVSGLGLEYIFFNPEKMKAYATMLPKILVPGGFAVIYPYVGEDVAGLWKSNGFDVVYKQENQYAPQIYTLIGDPSMNPISPDR